MTESLALPPGRHFWSPVAEAMQMGDSADRGTGGAGEDAGGGNDVGDGGDVGADRAEEKGAGRGQPGRAGDDTAGSGGGAGAPAPSQLRGGRRGGGSRGLARAGQARSDLPSGELARWMAPLRAGDPLGLGAERPPPPPDPDRHDLDREGLEFARSLLSPDQLRELDEDIAANGYLSIEEVRRLVLTQTVQGSVELGGLDPELLALIDARIDYKIFIAGDNIYTREELYENFPFHEFGVQPEAVFAQQELGVFPPRHYALTEELEYLARDAGDESVDFIMLEDLVGQAARAGYTARRAPLRVAKTKVFVGKERWDDFALLHRVFRGGVRVASAQLAYEGARPSGSAHGGRPLLSLVGGLMGGAVGGPLALEVDDAQRRAEKSQRREAERREKERRAQERRALEARQEEARREEARRAEERLEEERRAESERLEQARTAQRAAEADVARLTADMRRLEAMFAASLEAARTEARAPARPGAQAPAPDSVEL